MTFSGLRPKTDNFLRLGPPPQLLICLFGTLQCGIHGIPVEIWFPRSFPREAPWMFLVPTTGATIRPTSMVDAAGRVVHPYLMGWRADMALTEVLRVIMGALAVDPPFYAGAGRPMGVPSYSPAPSTIVQPQYGTLSGIGAGYGSPVNTGVAAAATAVVSPSIMKATKAAGKEGLIELRRLLKERISGRFRKLQHELHLEGDRLVAEATQLEERKGQLVAGGKKLQEAINQLETDVNTIRQRKEVIGKLVDGDEEPTLDLESLVRPEGPISQQLFDLYVKDAAYGDTMFVLTKTFLDGQSSISLDTFIKQLREVARQQFLIKERLLRIRKEFPIVK